MFERLRFDAAEIQRVKRGFIFAGLVRQPIGDGLLASHPRFRREHRANFGF